MDTPKAEEPENFAPKCENCGTNDRVTCVFPNEYHCDRCDIDWWSEY
jgi:hypothetical protein